MNLNVHIYTHTGQSLVNKKQQHVGWMNRKQKKYPLPKCHFYQICIYFVINLTELVLSLKK